MVAIHGWGAPRGERLFCLTTRALKNYLWAPAAALSLGACIHDDVSRQSPPEPARHFSPISAREEITRTEGPTGKFAPNRVYLVTRLETADQPRGEWRAVGSSIQQEGSRIRFVEMGTGRLMEFTAPHQVTPMASRQDERVAPNAIDPVAAPSSGGNIGGRGNTDYAAP